jgi:predicted RNase H-like nuclease (RuvC/YqgF family)
VVATLPEAEQRAAALAGKDELKQAAKRVRESRRKPREEQAEATEHSEAAPVPASDEVSALRQRVAQLEAENASLREQVQSLSAQLV